MNNDIAEDGIWSCDDRIVINVLDKGYARRLAKAAERILGSARRDAWPVDGQHSHWPRGQISQHGPYGHLELLIRAADEEITGVPAMCIIQGATLPWCMRLGAAWHVDPTFFVHHARSLDPTETLQMPMPFDTIGTETGLNSFRLDVSSVIVRGHVDCGTPSRPPKDDEVPKSYEKHCHDDASGVRRAHTNISFHFVREGQHMMMVDRYPEWELGYIIDELVYFPYETIYRFATLDNLGFVAVPFFGWHKNTAFPPIPLMFQRGEDKAALLHGFSIETIDDFLYKAALIRCGSELDLLYEELFYVQEICLGIRQPYPGSTEQSIIQTVQRVLARLERCIIENIEYEHKLDKDSRARIAEALPGKNFESMTARISDMKPLIQESLFRASMPRMKVNASFDTEHSGSVSGDAGRAWGVTALKWSSGLLGLGLTLFMLRRLWKRE